MRGSGALGRGRGVEIAGRLVLRGALGEQVGGVELARRVRWDDAKALGTYRKDIPTALANAIIRAMEKEPEKRFATMAEFEAAL